MKTNAIIIITFIALGLLSSLVGCKPTGHKVTAIVVQQIDTVHPVNSTGIIDTLLIKR